MAFITPMRTWALISVLARAARLYSRFFPHAPALPQLANKLALLSELLGWDLTVANQFGISSVADSRQRLEHRTTNLRVRAKINLFDYAQPMQLEFRGMKWILDHIRRLIAVFSPKPASGYEPITPADPHQTNLVPSSEPLRKSGCLEADLDAKPKELGAEDGLKDISSVTTRMLIAFGKHGIKSIEDLADCATDDLNGWSETKDGKTIRHTGILGRFKVSRQDCEAIIMDARTKAGWFK